MPKKYYYERTDAERSNIAQLEASTIRSQLLIEKAQHQAAECQLAVARIRYLLSKVGGDE